MSKEKTIKEILRKNKKKESHEENLEDIRRKRKNNEKRIRRGDY